MNKLSVPMRKWEFILGWIYYVLQLLIIPSALDYINYFLLGNLLSYSALNIIYFCLNFIFVIGIFWRFLLENGKIALKRPMRCLAGAAIGIGAYWHLSILTSMLILYIYPEFSNVNDSSINSMVQENTTMMSFATIILVPIAEEVLYRGLMFRGLYNRNRFVAFLVSVCAFAAVHVIGYIGRYEPLHLALCFLQYIPAGLCLAFAYAFSDSIIAPIVIHILVNLFGILSMR